MLYYKLNTQDLKIIRFYDRKIQIRKHVYVTSLSVHVLTLTNFSREFLHPVSIFLSKDFCVVLRTRHMKQY